MLIRKPGSKTWLLLALTIFQFIRTCNAFTFVFSSQPSQCGSLTAQWSGGTGPYRLYLIPVGHVTPEIRTIVNMEIPAGQASTSLTLKFPENSRFVAVMSDSAGFGTGGTSTVYTVGSGPSDCLPTSPPKADFYMYTNDGAPSQCGSYPVSWDSGVASPVHIYGIIPGGQSFDLNVPSSGTNFDWTANVREGTQMLFLAVGGNNENGGSTDIATVTSGSSDCINTQSPSSTAGPPAGGVSTVAQSGTGTAPASSNPTQTGGASASGTGTAEATAGSSMDPTATGSPGGSGTPGSNPTGNPNLNPSRTTKGSEGGTVTGDPHLPAATHNSLGDPSHLNLGAIIGGTLGGVTFILLLLLIWLVCARRRHERQLDDHERLMTQDRTDLLADSVPITSHDSYTHDWFRAEPFEPPMSAAEFARRTGGYVPEYEDRGQEYRDDYDQSMSSLDHGAATHTSAPVAMYGALALTPSRSTSGHGHRSSQSHSRSLSHSHNVSHSPAHSTSRHGASSHGHSRSFSNPLTFTSNSGVSGPRDGVALTPPTPTSAADPFANPVTRPPPSSWHNHASTSANIVPRARRSSSIHAETAEGKTGEEEEPHESDQEVDVVDIPPSYESLRRSGPRVMNP